MVPVPVSEPWYRAMFESSTVPMALADEDGRLVLANPAYLEMVGRTQEETRGRSSREWTHPDDIAQHHAMEELRNDADLRGEVLRLEKRYVRPDGDIRWGWVSASAVTGPEGQSWTMAVIHDTTDRRRKEDALQVAVVTDPLTGLLNRRGWRDRLAAVTTGLREPLGLAMLDMDNFKRYNDSHGHAAGDRLLTDFAAAATEILGPTPLLARWGGEEFALALPGCLPEHVGSIVERLADAVPCGQTFSAGWVLRGLDEDLMDCLDRADERLYAAKRDGGNGRIVGNPEPRASPFLANRA